MKCNSPLALFALFAGMAACNLPSSALPSPTLSARPPLATQFPVASPVILPTLTATESLPTAQQPSLTLPPSIVPSATTTATLIPTSTLSGPTATFIKNANCREGPSQSYEVVTSFFSGQTVQIIGRNPDFDNTWWYVLIPGTNGKCWVSLTTAQAEGDFGSIPTVVPK